MNVTVAIGSTTVATIAVQPVSVTAVIGVQGPGGAVTAEMIGIRDETEAFKVLAAASEIAASDSALASAGSASESSVSASESLASQQAAATSETNALDSKNAATISASEALASQSAAAESALIMTPATTVTAQAFGDAAIVGTALPYARQDHKHAMPATPTTIIGNAGTATALSAGADRTKLDGIADNANNYSLPTATAATLGGVKPDGVSILNTAGVLSATKTSIGLGNVDNTSDADKPVSTLQATAIGLKALNLLTGYASAAGTVAATDTVLQAVNKLNGNDEANLTTAKAYADAQDAFLMRTPDQGIVTTYAASGSTGIQIANNDNLNFGTGDFTLVWKGSLPDWTPAAPPLLIAKLATTAGGFTGFLFRVWANGTLDLNMYRDSATSPSGTAVSLPAFADGSVHTLKAVVRRETSSATGSITYYADGVLVGAPVVIPAAATISLSNTVASYIVGYFTGAQARYAATTQAAYAFNRALSAAEQLSLHKYGVAESDKWGSQTELILLQNDRDFSGGTIGSWVAYNANGAVIYDLGPTGTGTGKITVNTGAYVHAVGPSVTVVGGYVRHKCSVYIASGHTFTAVRIGSINMTGGLLVSERAANLAILDQWQEISSIYSVAADYIFQPYIHTDGGSAGNVVYFDNVSSVKVGATLALEPEGIQPAPGQWLDSSSNKLHALQPAAGSSLTRKKDNFEIRWTNTWAGTHEAQYVGGIDQAVLPPNCYIESIIGVVSGAVIEDIILGDGVDTDRWVTITTGLATGTQTFAIANRVSDGTNRKLVVDPDANFTGSISWIIKGIML